MSRATREQFVSKKKKNAARRRDAAESNATLPPTERQMVWVRAIQLHVGVSMPYVLTRRQASSYIRRYARAIPPSAKHAIRERAREAADA